MKEPVGKLLTCQINWNKFLNYICFHVVQIDYFERAKRLEEIPLIKSAYEEQRIKDMDLWEQQEEERVRFLITCNICSL